MTSASSAELQCRSCRAMNPALNLFCGACGDAIKHAENPKSTWVSTIANYFSPSRALILGTIAFLVGLPASIGSFLALQSDGIFGFILDLVAGRRVSTVPMVVFVVGFMLTVIGVGLLLYGASLSLARSSARDHGEDAYKHARPIASRLMHESRQQFSAAVARGQQKIVEAEPKVTQAASRGRNAATEELLPRVSAAAEQGREQWRKTAPEISAAATRAHRRFARAAKRRLSLTDTETPTSVTPPPLEHGPPGAIVDATSGESVAP
jgi:hypothetical protein